MSGPGTQLWRSPPALRASSYLLTTLAVASVPWAFYAGPHHISNTALGWWLFGSVLWLGMAAAIARLAFQPFLLVDGDGLWIRNVTSEERVPWAAVERVVPGAWGIEIWCRDGTCITASAIAKSNLSFITGNAHTRADRVAAAIRERAPGGGPGAVDGPTDAELEAGHTFAKTMIAWGLVLIAARIALEFL